MREQSDQQKAAVFKLIEENNALHNELKNVTVHDILAEFQNNEQQRQQSPNNREFVYCLYRYFFVILNLKFYDLLLLKWRVVSKSATYKRASEKANFRTEQKQVDNEEIECWYSR